MTKLLSRPALAAAPGAAPPVASSASAPRTSATELHDQANASVIKICQDLNFMVWIPMERMPETAAKFNRSVSIVV